VGKGLIKQESVTSKKGYFSHSPYRLSNGKHRGVCKLADSDCMGISNETDDPSCSVECAECSFSVGSLR